ncbi:TetR/AcrR family transcriptional regulator [Bacillus sp. 3103sda1]|uniref:TetR/AcrR family transcriptional regulator n=1 Tax=Bacillus sp. 3103sda1 TaxID=2953808 RepID=UPI0020A0A3F7|nr:TetR/AcrR family transcriptional regulator [Bacillus sp. 3103sda1]MCP1124451.1 TetR/AcrR family transcriptional regulator [Bacillus sp. 3103sda1]
MRERIIKAFIEEIHDKGMKFTMDDLANRIGVNKRYLYQHFSSKVEILELIIDQTLSEVTEKTEQIMADTSLSLIEKIRGVCTAMPSHFEFYDFKVLEQMKRYYPEQWTKVNAALNEWEALRLLIEEGIQQGELNEINTALAIKLIIDATNSIFDQRFYMENNITLPEALSSIVDVLLFGLVKNKS